MKRVVVLLLSVLMLLGLTACGREWVEVSTVTPITEPNVSICVTGYSKRWSTVDVVIENNTGKQLEIDPSSLPSVHKLVDAKWMRLAPPTEYTAELIIMTGATGEWEIDAKNFVNRLSPGSYRVAFTAKEARSASGQPNPNPSFTVYDYFEVE